MYSCTLLLEQRPFLAVVHHELGWFYGHIFRTVVGLVDSNQVVSQLEHVVAKANDDKLCMPAVKTMSERHRSWRMAIKEQDITHFVCSLT